VQREALFGAAAEADPVGDEFAVLKPRPAAAGVLRMGNRECGGSPEPEQYFLDECRGEFRLRVRGLQVGGANLPSDALAPSPTSEKTRRR
jgi:hypothetical protein